MLFVNVPSKFMVKSMLNIEIAYARNVAEQIIIPLQIPIDSTVANAIQNSAILKKFPEIDLQINKVGIFSKIVSLSDKLHDGDRIEIYRSLIIDPKQARVLRAKRKKK